MNSQAVLEILISIAKESQQGITNLKKMVDDLGTSITSLNGKSASGVSDSFSAASKEAQAAANSAKESLNQIKDTATSTGAAIDTAVSSLSGFQRIAAV